MTQPDLSIVLGSLNRRRLLSNAINSVRANGFAGNLEIIVVDGGSRDGTCEWLAQQADILTVIQPNRKISLPDGRRRRLHSWGEFMNIGFRAARAPWIVMLSDDLILCPGALQSGLEELQGLARRENIGGGAFFWRDYPRAKTYHVKLLRNRVVLVNHGFLSAEALASVGYIDESSYEFYAADGDLTMRLNLAGWKTVALSNAFAEHLSHPVDWRRRLLGRPNPATAQDMFTFESRYGNLTYYERAIYKTWADQSRTAQAFWKIAPITCLQGYLIRYLDSAIRPQCAPN